MKEGTRLSHSRLKQIVDDLRSAIDAMEAESQQGRHTGYVSQIEQLHHVIEQLQASGESGDKTWSSYGSSGQTVNNALDEPGSVQKKRE